MMQRFNNPPPPAGINQTKPPSQGPPSQGPPSQGPPWQVNSPAQAPPNNANPWFNAPTRPPNAPAQNMQPNATPPWLMTQPTSVAQGIPPTSSYPQVPSSVAMPTKPQGQNVNQSSSASWQTSQSNVSTTQGYSQMSNQPPQPTYNYNQQYGQQNVQPGYLPYGMPPTNASYPMQQNMQNKDQNAQQNSQTGGNQNNQYQPMPPTNQTATNAQTKGTNQGTAQPGYVQPNLNQQVQPPLPPVTNPYYSQSQYQQEVYQQPPVNTYQQTAVTQKNQQSYNYQTSSSYNTQQQSVYGGPQNTQLYGNQMPQQPFYPGPQITTSSTAAVYPVLSNTQYSTSVSNFQPTSTVSQQNVYGQQNTYAVGLQNTLQQPAVSSVIAAPSMPAVPVVPMNGAYGEDPTMLASSAAQQYIQYYQQWCASTMTNPQEIAQVMAQVSTYAYQYYQQYFSQQPNPNGSVNTPPSNPMQTGIPNASMGPMPPQGVPQHPQMQLPNAGGVMMGNSLQPPPPAAVTTNVPTQTTVNKKTSFTSKPMVYNNNRKT